MSTKQSQNAAPVHPRCHPRPKVDCIVGYERYFRRHPEAATPVPCVELPFVCDHCHESRYELEMIGGDGDLICKPCFESYVSVLIG